MTVKLRFLTKRTREENEADIVCRTGRIQGDAASMKEVYKAGMISDDCRTLIASDNGELTVRRNEVTMMWSRDEMH